MPALRAASVWTTYFLLLLFAVGSTPALGQNVISTIAGTGVAGYGGDGYNATALNLPAGLAVDVAGNLFIADSANNRVRKLTPGFVISTVAGSGVSGFSGDGGLATAATLNSPAGVSIDASGNLLIADSGNHRIRKVTPAGTISTIAGNGVPGFGGDGGPATNASLNTPIRMTVDSTGRLLIADSFNHRIRRVKLDGSIETVAGTGFQGFSGDGAAAAAAQLSLPTAVAVDNSGNILIADAANSRIRKVAADGTITTIAGTNTAGFSGDGGPATSAQLFGPADVRVDTAGNVFIADFFNHRVRRIGVDGIVATVAGDGNSGYGGDGGPAVNAQIIGPYGIGIDSGGNLFIADRENNRLRKVAANGLITTIAGSELPGFTGDGPAGIFALIRGPGGVAVDPAGNVLMADTGNYRVRKVTPASSVSTVAGTGIQGFSGDGGPALAANLGDPSSVAVDGAGNIFVSDAYTHRIRKVTPSGVIATIAGTGLAGYSGDGGPASIAKLSSPSDLAVDGQGNVFIADLGNNRNRKISVDGTITTVAGNGEGGYSGDGGPAIAAKLDDPSAVAVDGAGNIYIADRSNHRVRVVNSAGFISTFAGTGEAEFGGDDDAAVDAQLALPSGVALDSHGNLFIAAGSRIRMVNPQGIITTVAGNGTLGYTGDGGPATSAQIAGGQIALDGAGNLLIAGGHVVRQVTFTGAGGLPEVTGISPFSGVQGTVVSATITGSALSGATGVTFSGSGVTASIQAGGTAADLPISITVAAGASVGLRTFTVTTADGTSESFSGFTVVSSVTLPSITSINPLKGVIGASVQAVVGGSGLTGATAVTFSGTGVTASIGSGATDTSLPITISIAANASLDLRVLTVTTPVGTSPAFNGFTVVRPTITGISPSLGTPGFSVPAMLTGANLAGATFVSFTGSGVSATMMAGATDTNLPLLISVAAGAAPGVRNITVTAAGVTSEPFTGFTVVAFDLSGVITTFAGDGTTPFKGDGDPAIAAGLDAPGHVATDMFGNVYIADRNHNRVRKVDGAGVITTVAGTGAALFGGDGGPAVLAGISEPSGLAVDNSGNLFIMDRGNHRVRKVALNGIITTVAGTGVPGYSGDDGPATLAQIQFAIGIAVDSAGNLYIADRDNNRIRKVASNGIISTIAGNGTAGFGGDGGPAISANISFPSGVAVDAAGTLFIADHDNHRIRKVTPDGVITTVAGSASSGFAGDGGAAVSAQLHFPENVALDGSGNLLIADYGNRRLRKVTPGGTITTAAGNGGQVFSGDGGPAILAAIHPTDVAVDAVGNLFIADFDANRIRKITKNNNVILPPNYLTFVPPVVGGSYLDPMFGTTFTRVSDAVNTISADNGQPLIYVAAEYSTKSPFNADNSKLLLLEFSYFSLYDAVTLQRIKPFCCNGPIVAASSEPLWSRTDPNIFYFHPVSSNQLKTYNVATDVVKVVHTFSEYSTINAQGESEISYDGDHIVLAGDDHQIFVYTISTDTKGPVFEIDGKNPIGLDAVYISPDNNVLLAWATNGTGRYEGEELYDKDMNFLRQVAKDNGHKHMTRDLDGSEVLIQTNAADPTPIPNCQNGIVKINLATTQQTCLLQLDFSMSVHISAVDHGGWIFVETNNNNTATFPWFAYTNELLQIKIDGTEVRRLGHHRSDGSTYDGQPRIATSRDGSRFVFNSNMMGPTPDVYLAAGGTGTAVPPAVLSSLSPTIAEDNDFTLTVNGTNFSAGSAVVWNGSRRPTTFVNNTQLTATISSADLAVAGVTPVAVFNPILGGGVSNALSFTITKRRKGQLLSD